MSTRRTTRLALIAALLCALAAGGGAYADSGSEKTAKALREEKAMRLLQERRHFKKLEQQNEKALQRLQVQLEKAGEAKKAPDTARGASPSTASLEKDLPRNPSVLAAGQQHEDATLFPGETCTFGGVKVTWEMSTDDLPTTKGVFSHVGKVRFSGPITRDLLLDSPLLVDMDGQLLDYGKALGIIQKQGGKAPASWPRGRKELCLYIDELAIWVYPSGTKLGIDPRLQLRFVRATRLREFDSTGHNLQELWVSHMCPIRLNRWRFALSEKPVSYPGGSEYFQIEGLNTETGERIVMPATEGAQKRFGRFRIEAHYVYPETRTVRLDGETGADYTIRGGRPTSSKWKRRRAIRPTRFSIAWRTNTDSRSNGSRCLRGQPSRWNTRKESR